MAHPGGNITGLNTLSRDLAGKRIQLLIEIVPHLSTIGVLRGAGSQQTAIAIKEYEAAGRAIKVDVQSLIVQGLNPDAERAVQSAIKGRANALITTQI